MEIQYNGIMQYIRIKNSVMLNINYLIVEGTTMLTFPKDKYNFQNLNEQVIKSAFQLRDCVKIAIFIISGFSRRCWFLLNLCWGQCWYLGSYKRSADRDGMQFHLQAQPVQLVITDAGALRRTLRLHPGSLGKSNVVD